MMISAARRRQRGGLLTLLALATLACTRGLTPPLPGARGGGASQLAPAACAEPACEVAPNVDLDAARFDAAAQTLEPAMAERVLQGVWVSLPYECIATTYRSPASPTSCGFSVLELGADGRYAAYDHRGDADCGPGPAVPPGPPPPTRHRFGRYRLLRSDQAGLAVRFTSASAAMAVHTTDAAEAANAVGVCGITDWRAGDVRFLGAVVDAACRALRSRAYRPGFANDVGASADLGLRLQRFRIDRKLWWMLRLQAHGDQPAGRSVVVDIMLKVGGPADPHLCGGAAG